VSAHVVHAGPAWTRFVTELPNGTTVDKFVAVGGKRGLVIDNPYTGADGNLYGVVGTADLIRVDNNSEAFTDGEKVYVEPDNVTFTATATGNQIVGIADRPKAAVAGPLFVQLIPGISG
jgi:hypothetical protein